MRTSGRQIAADALHRIELTALATNLHWVANVWPLLELGRRPPDPAAGLRELLQDAQLVTELVTLAAAESDDPPADPSAPHPRAAVRISSIAALRETAAISADDRPAAALWRHADRWTRLAHDASVRLIADRATGYRPVDSTTRVDETICEAQRSRAADVDRALDQLGLTGDVPGLCQAIRDGHGEWLAGQFAAAGWVGPLFFEPRDFLTAAAVATVTRGALDEGGRFRCSWSAPPQLIDRHGRPIPVDELAEAAVTGDCEALESAMAPAPASQPEPDWPDAPPCPPFRAGAGERVWEVDLSRAGGAATLGISDDAVSVEGEVARYDDIAAVSMKIDARSELRTIVSVRLTSGDRLTLTAAAADSDGKASITAAFDYLWGLFRRKVGPRLRTEIGAAIEAGGEVTVAHLRLGRPGITAQATGRHVGWHQVAEQVFDDDKTQIVLVAGQPVPLHLDLDNAILLQDLIPELRVRYA